MEIEIRKITQTHYVCLKAGKPIAHTKFIFAGENWIVYLQGDAGNVVTYKSLTAAKRCMKELAGATTGACGRSQGGEVIAVE